VHVIAKPALVAAAKRYPNAASWIWNWYAVATKASWTSLVDVRASYPTTDQFKCCLIFDACGNDYRLITRVTYADKYQRGTLLIKAFVTHADYDKDGWKGDC